MKKIILNIFLLFLSLVFFIVVFLSTVGLETNQFNNLIIKETTKNYPKIKLKLDKIKIKIELKKFSLFLTTKKPEIEYSGLNLPIDYFKAYIRLKSIFNSENLLESVFLKTNETKVEEIKKLALLIKPSNFKNFILNNLEEGSIKASLNLSFDDELKLKKYNIDGYFNQISIIQSKELRIDNLNLIFSANKETISLDSISGVMNNILVEKGEINIDRSKDLEVDGNLTAKATFNEHDLARLISEKNNILKNKINLKANITNKFKLKFDNTLKLIDYSLNIEGKINESNIKLSQPLVSTILDQDINNLFINNSNIKYNFSKKNNNYLLLKGFYKINNLEYQKFKLENNNKNLISKYDLDIDFIDSLNFKILNYKKSNKKIAKITTKIELTKKFIMINELKYKAGNNLIILKDLKFDHDKKIKSFESIKIKTSEGNKEKNSFDIKFGDTISILGSKYDATNLIKIINEKKNSNLFKLLNNKVSIKIDNINTRLSTNLRQFSLIGELEKGEFIKITSKGKFFADKYLDIMLKKNKINGLKYLEVFSDLPEPILSDYKFFKGIQGGKLLFTSSFDKNSSSSKMIIENFKVKNAPGFLKLLSLADLGGMVDLASGEGLSFDKMEIQFSKNQEILKLEELYAVGSSVSVLMEGYVENKTGLISLKGTMVPAKDLNKLISKIPLIGNILIPKEIGEGLFGVSFKMKGLPKNVKTTVNPIKSLTPRFITKALEKRKKN